MESPAQGTRKSPLLPSRFMMLRGLAFLCGLSQGQATLLMRGVISRPCHLREALRITPLVFITAMPARSACGYGTCPRERGASVARATNCSSPRRDRSCNYSSEPLPLRSPRRPRRPSRSRNHLRRVRHLPTFHPLKQAVQQEARRRPGRTICARTCRKESARTACGRLPQAAWARRLRQPPPPRPQSHLASRLKSASAFP
jgi:hypothetical protein